MKIFAIDTSSIVATCAVMDDEKLIGEYTINHKRTHSQKLMPMIKELMESCELKIDDIDVFAASVGPGSFTGLRIGIATIKALAHTVNKPVVGVPTIDALAYNIPYFDGLIVPIMDARRKRVYTGIYHWERDKFVIDKNQDVLEIDKLIDILKKRKEYIILSGDAVHIYRDKIIEVLGQKAIFAPRHLNMPRSSSVAELAMEKYRQGEYQSFYDLVPEYLRKSQAEREYDKKNSLGESNG